MTNQNRQPAGTPTGGQFSANTHGEATGVDLMSRTDMAAVQAAVAEARRTGKPVPVEGVEHNGFRSDYGTTCGDTSLGPEPSNRQTWATGRDDEPFITVTATYYVTARRDGDAHDLDYDDWNDAVRDTKRWHDAMPGARQGTEPKPIRYAVENRTEWVAHRDVDEVGGTEIRSDYTYEDGSALYYSSPDSAGRVAREKAEHEDWDNYFPENWK